jgi:calcineurin-like phosphoesterase family protein
MFKTKQINHISYEFHVPFIRGYKSNNLFNEIYTGPLMISDKLILSHEPLCLELGVTRTPIAFNIHGHDHSGEYYNDNCHLNLAQNVWGYTPLNLKEFINDGILKHISSIHRATIDKAINRKEL